MWKESNSESRYYQPFIRMKGWIFWRLNRTRNHALQALEEGLC